MMRYLEARRREMAPIASYSAALGALRFLEEAGEVPTDARISKGPSLTSFIKEAEMLTSQMKSLAGENTNKRQAPPMSLLFSPHSKE